MREIKLSSGGVQEASLTLLRCMWVFAVLGGWLGIALAIRVMSSRYTDEDRQKGKIALCVAIFVAVGSIVLGSLR